MSKIEIIDLRKFKNYFPINEVEKFIRNIQNNKFNSKIKYAQCSLLIKNKNNSYFFFRDRLGIHKFFYCFKPQKILIANTILDLVNSECKINNIFSFKPGVLYELYNGKLCIKNSLNTINTKMKNNKISEIRNRIKINLKQYFQNIKKDYPNYNYVVCLSGGLDSSIVAYYSKRYLNNKNLNFTSFSFTNNLLDDQLDKQESVSEDFLIAKKISKKLKIPFIPIKSTMKIDNKTLIKILISAQDYRDFNIHCATLNYFLGKKLKKRFNPLNTILITGDLMNEFVIDYKEEKVEGKVYYKLPNIPLDRLRNFLVKGLDTSDRELGVFYNFGFYTVQPYNCVIDQYLSIDSKYLKDEKFKYKMNKYLIPKEIFSLISLKKNRAQSCDKGFGALNLFINSRITQKKLIKDFNKIYLDDKSHEIIEFGKYR